DLLRSVQRGVDHDLLQPAEPIADVVHEVRNVGVAYGDVPKPFELVADFLDLALGPIEDFAQSVDDRVVNACCEAIERTKRAGHHIAGSFDDAVSPIVPSLHRANELVGERRYRGDGLRSENAHSDLQPIPMVGELV